MAEYIEREKLAEGLKIWQNMLIETYGKNDEYVSCLDSVLLGIDNIPAADVRPVVRGKWRLYSPLTDTYECDKCGYQVVDESFRTNYCPNCGAMMEES